ncbi:hypothetical protein T06_3343 [Trichinella sp. T6]|nr:hypothetical protein T06_3343 [Trichinella sp. T6]
MAGTTGSMTVQCSALTKETDRQLRCPALRLWQNDDPEIWKVKDRATKDDRPDKPSDRSKMLKSSSDTRLGSTGYEPESSLIVVSRNRDPGHGAQPANKKSAESEKNIIKDLTMVLLAAAMERCQKLVPHVRSLPYTECASGK